MTETVQPAITADMTMEEILQRMPSAQRALFQRYHVGGCSSCAFQPTDTLAQVCKDHNLLDVNEVVAHLMKAQELDERIRAEPLTIKGWLDAGETFAFIDVRQPDELAQARVPEAVPLDYQNSDKYMQLPREHKLVFLCKDGDRSLDVAAYFIGHGFTDVWCVRGGIDGWRQAVDPSIPNY